MRPTGLTEVTLVKCVLNTTGFLVMKDMTVMREMSASSIAISVVFSYLVLWNFWEGRNWARWLVMIGSFASLFNLFFLRTATPLQGAVMVMETMLGVCLLYWLNTSAVRDYFKRGGAALG